MKCHLCGNTAFLHIASRIENRVELNYLLGKKYEIVKCVFCKLYFINPQPTEEELNAFYSSYYLDEQWEKGEKRFNLKIFKMVHKLKLIGSVLDIGCGNGELLNIFKTKGYDVQGVEQSKDGYQTALQQFSLPVFFGSIDDFKKKILKKDGYDIILLINVLEHLRNPNSALSFIANILNKNGIVIIVVPDVFLHLLIGNICRFFRKRDPYVLNKRNTFLVGFDPPQHLTSFRPRTLLELAKKHGFSSIYMHHAPHVRNKGGFRNIRNYIKPLVVNLSNFLYYVTLKKILIGYSTILFLEKRGLSKSC